MNLQLSSRLITSLVNKLDQVGLEDQKKVDDLFKMDFLYEFIKYRPNDELCGK